MSGTTKGQTPFTALRIRQETKERFINQAKEEFINHHPDFRNFNITHDFLLNKLLDYYLEH